jgi:hypothetical protein
LIEPFVGCVKGEPLKENEVFLGEREAWMPIWAMLQGCNNLKNCVFTADFSVFFGFAALNPTYMSCKI